MFFIFYKQQQKAISFVFILVFVFYATGNFLLHQKFRNDYFVNEREKTEAATIEKLIQENPDKTFLIGVRAWWDRKPTRLSDTFFNYPNVMRTYIDHIVETITEEQNILFADIALQKNWGANDPNYKADSPNNYYPRKQNIDYFIFPKVLEWGIEELPNGDIKTDKFSVLAIKGVKVIHTSTSNIFNIFENQNPKALPVFVWIPANKAAPQ